MQEIDKQCLDAFPELLELYGIGTLKEASGVGSYIFFEDYFNAFVEDHKNNDDILRRVADYIECNAQIDNFDLQNLMTIGVLEGLVNREVHGIAKYLKPQSKKLLKQAEHRTKIYRHIWRLD